MRDIVSPLSGIRSPFGERRTAFSPAALFALAEPGVWNDPSDLTTLFQDTAGTTPVTTPGQSVALALDKSKGLVLGSERIADPTLTNQTGWAVSGDWVSVTGGFEKTATLANSNLTYTQAVAAEVGKTYLVEVTLNTASSLLTYFGTSSANGSVAFTGNGTFRQYLTVTGASGSLTILTFRFTAAQTGSITAVSVKELPGFHATQATAGSRPIYALLPANGVRNLANGSASPTNDTLWTASNVSNGITLTRVATGIDTDGLPYADFSVVGTATASTFQVATLSAGQRIPASVGQTWTASFIARQVSGTAPPTFCGVRTEIAGETAPATSTETSTPVAATITGSDVVYSTTYTLANAATNQVRNQVTIRTENGSTVNYVVRIKAIQFELGSTRTAYQFNYSATNIAQPPFAQVGALLFDGVDDFLQTPSVDFAGGGISGSNILTGTWSLTVDGGTATATESPAGTLNLTGDGTNGANAVQSVTTQVGRTYRIDFTVGSSANTISAGTSAFATDLIPTTVMNVGVNCVYFTATTTTSFILFRKAGAALSTTSGITVREAIRPADKMTVFAGVRKIRDTAQAAVVSVGNLPDTVNGSLSLRAPALALNNYALRSRGTATAPATSGAFLAPDTAVLSGLADISGDAATLRRNGTQISFSNADQGTGNFGNHSIYIGQDGTGTALPFNGYLYSLIVRGAATSTDVISLTERWVNSRTGAY